MRGDVSSISHTLSTTSLVVTCDSVNSLLGNHMKSADLLALVCGVFCEFVTSHWYPGSGVVLDCIDS